MQDVLIVSRNFAPASHVSGERAIKLAKYLPEFGWRPTVLTGRRPTAGLPEDPELLDQVSGVEIIRTRAPEFSLFYGGRRGAATARRDAPRRGALHPKAWLVPDSQLLWYPFAVRAALGRARTLKWNAVLATSFPPTAILIAHTIASRLRLPYVIDFRDSWTTFHSAPRRPARLAELERRLEAEMIRDASAVVAVDFRMVEHAFARIVPRERPPFCVIPNGYDEDDFLGVEPAELPWFSMVHTGQLRRSPRPLWEALSHALQNHPELLGRVHLWQIGFVDSRAESGLHRPPEGVVVHHVPPMTQREAIAYMLGADLLLVEEFGSVMPSKTLQYLRASRPILAFRDQGGMIRDVLKDMPEAYLVGRDEPERAGGVIAATAAGPRRSTVERGQAVAAYSRREIARRFARVLDDACQRRDRAARPAPPAARPRQSDRVELGMR